MHLARGQRIAQPLGTVPRVVSKGPASAEGQFSSHWRTGSCCLGYSGALKVRGKVSGDPELHKSEVYKHTHRSICTHTSDNEDKHTFSDCPYTPMCTFSPERIPFLSADSQVDPGLRAQEENTRSQSNGI